MKKIIDLSPNFQRAFRSKEDIKFVIIHYTGMQSAIESIKRLKNRKSNVSCHYFISKKGIVTQMVLDKDIAWHAGKSRWKNYKNLNKNSIGIELDNKGHEFGYEKFPQSQIKSVIFEIPFLFLKKRINFFISLHDSKFGSTSEIF